MRDGYTVVCSEPTAALMLREEYVKLTEDLDAELVAANTMDVGQYLLGLDARGQLPRPRRAPPRPRRLSPALPPCARSTSARRASSCCATSSGSTSSSSTAAARAWAAPTGWPAIASGPRSAPAAGCCRRLRDGDIEIGATECGACRIQMEQGLTKRTLHPIKLLSLGYGLNPLLRQHFKDPKPRHVMS